MSATERTPHWLYLLCTDQEIEQLIELLVTLGIAGMELEEVTDEA